MTRTTTIGTAELIDPALVADTLDALRTPAGQANPYPHYARLHEAGVAGTTPDGALLVVGYDACAVLLREHRLVKSPERLLAAAGFPDWEQRPALRMLYGSMLMRNPPEHAALRSAVSAAFTPRRIAGLAGLIEGVTDGLLAGIDGSADFVEAFAFPLPVTVIGALLGIAAADRPMFQHLVREWTTILELLAPWSVDRADAAAREIASYLDDLARARRGRPTDDLVSALVAQGTLSGDELVTMLALLLGAGFETTTGLLANGLLALLGAPGQAARLRAEPALAAGAAQEILRFDTPLQMLFGRSTADELDAAGLQLPRGQRLITVVGAANRDPRVYDRPDELRLDRVGPPPLSFGGGIHYCLGAPLARLEASIAFPRILRAFPRLRLSGPPVHRDGLTLHGYTRIPVSTR